MGYLGDFTTSNTVYVYFNTFDSNDPSASVTITGLLASDIEIYKDGSITQRASDSGYTLLDTDGIDFDGNTGIHGFSIDLSDNTDVGFYAAGSEYVVVVASITVDAATVNFVAGTFSIERAGGALALLKGTNSLANIEDKIDIIDTNVDDIETAVITNAAGVDIAADIIAMKAETALIVGDTNELQTDWTDAGRLDAILDIIAADVVNIDGQAMRGTDSAALATALATAQTDLNTLTGTDGATLATAQANYAPSKAGDARTLTTAGILAIWHQALTAIVTAGSVGKLIKDEVTAVRMQVLTDWINGGRLDLLLDAIPTTAMRGTDSAATAASLATAQADLDTLTGTDGATLATTQGNYAPSKAGDAMALTSGERDSTATALLDLANGVETSLTLREAMRLIAAASAGELGGAATTTITIEAANNPGTDRIVATVDADGNRSALTLTP